mmetsp:Transcript_14332/g.29717  ORF Transcript_14332/g.29717 Transcript_14332/m.29717 type:complete len:286 (-) Transcript_14332:193-1050(-)
MGQGIRRCAKGSNGRHQSKVGSLTCVQTGIILHVKGKSRILVARHEKSPPNGMKGRVPFVGQIDQFLFNFSLFFGNFFQHLLLFIVVVAENATAHFIGVHINFIAKSTQGTNLAPEGSIFVKDAHFIGQFGHDKGRSPSQSTFGSQDIRIQVIPDIENFFPRFGFQHGLQMKPIATLKGFALFQEFGRPIGSESVNFVNAVRVLQSTILRIHPKEIEVGIQHVGRFTRSHHDQVKQFEPIIFLLFIIVDTFSVVQKVHDGGCIFPVRVGEQKELDTIFLVSSQHG